jgi:uncharacterized protein (UPF0147 family)
MSKTSVKTKIELLKVLTKSDKNVKPLLIDDVHMSNNTINYFITFDEFRAADALMVLDEWAEDKNAERENVFKVSVVGDYEQLLVTEYIIE